MKRTVKFEIECGHSTCASEPGRFCPHIGSRKFGQIPVCTLFSDNGRNTELRESGGWVQRCAECLRAEATP